VSSTHSDPNARPCFLHGHVWRYYSDGSHDCLSCGLYHGPDAAMVNEMLRAASGSKVWAHQAMILARMKAPRPIAPIEPPLVFPMQTTDSGCTINQMSPGLIFTAGFVFTACVLLGARLGLAAWDYLSLGHL
jgi:hypothetical protein